MTRLLRNVFALVLTFVSATAFAGEVSAQGRVVSHSCGYYSFQEAEVSLRYRNTWVSEGSKVYLVYGWGGYYNGYEGPVQFDWDNTLELEVPETRDPVTGARTFTWNATLERTIAARSANRFYEHFDFVWRVVYPDGGEYWEKGNNSTYGYYAADFSELYRPCTSTGDYVTSPTPLPVTSVVKW